MLRMPLVLKKKKCITRMNKLTKQLHKILHIFNPKIMNRSNTIESTIIWFTMHYKERYES